jgi:hypothetical protein
MGPATYSFLFCYYFYFFENILKHIHVSGFSIKCRIAVSVSAEYRYTYPVSVLDSFHKQTKRVKLHIIRVVSGETTNREETLNDV